MSNHVLPTKKQLEVIWGDGIIIVKSMKKTMPNVLNESGLVQKEKS